MSSITSTSSYGTSMNYLNASRTLRPQRPSAEQMAAGLFSKLDTSNKGYIEQSDFETALSGMSSSTGSLASASEIFSQLDSDADGKVTQSEMTSGLQTLANSLDDQFNQIRVQGGMPPPPPPQNDDGFTEDELTEQLSEIGNSDSARASLLNKIVENFDEADTDGDGKVSFQEAMAYDQSTSSASTTASPSQNSTADGTNDRIFRQIMALVRAYGAPDSTGDVSTMLSTLISTSA